MVWAQATAAVHKEDDSESRRESERFVCSSQGQSLSNLFCWSLSQSGSLKQIKQNLTKPKLGEYYIRGGAGSLIITLAPALKRTHHTFCWPTVFFWVNIQGDDLMAHKWYTLLEVEITNECVHDYTMSLQVLTTRKHQISPTQTWWFTSHDKNVTWISVVYWKHMRVQSLLFYIKSEMWLVC